MKVLVVKLTSMGDALHLLPALTDLQSEFANVSIDWMIEENFAEIPRWHPSVDQVIPVATRRWRKMSFAVVKEFFSFIKALRATRYDVVVDAQGLMKSAVFARFAKLANGGRRVGFSADSIKERPAAKLYREAFDVERDQHAILRLRLLLAQAFNYSIDDKALNYQITLRGKTPDKKPNVLFLHGTTWPSKHLPDAIWRELRDLALADRYGVQLAWGNAREKTRAEWIADAHSGAEVLPKMTLTELAKSLQSASGAIAVDTGLGHLAAALGLPTVSIYGATNAQLTGAIGDNQIRLQTPFHCSPCLLKQCDKTSEADSPPPCYLKLSPVDIWEQLHQQIV